MQCPSCGTGVRPGQKFCMECGAALSSEDSTQLTAATPREPQHATTAPMATYAPPAAHEAATTQLPASPPRRAPYDDPTEVRVVTAETATVRLDRLDDTQQVTAVEPAAVASPEAEPGTGPEPPRRRFRLRPLLLVAMLAAAAAAVGALTTIIEIDVGGEEVAFEIGAWTVNDFGTNNAAAGLLAAGAMVVGALAWCFGLRWGAGLAGGAGAALAGWVALVIGLAEWPISVADTAASPVPVTITRDVGYWSLAGAGAVGILVLLASLARVGRDGRSGLDPWIAALGGVSFLLAAGGPLIPEGTADWSGNWSSDSLGVDLPTMFFVGRGVQLGLLALCGVVGFLLVRRYGLGLAIGSATAAGWLLVTAATEQTRSPIGPGFANPGAEDLQPHAVTIVGMAMIGFFSLVAVGMALLDSDR